ncbi:hypothetical protein VPH35_002424 [Triticum aestivum]
MVSSLESHRPPRGEQSRRHINLPRQVSYCVRGCGIGRIDGSTRVDATTDYVVVFRKDRRYSSGPSATAATGA